MDEFLDMICNESVNQPNFVKYVKGKILGLSCRKAEVLINFLTNFKFSNSHIKDLIIDLVKFRTRKLKLDGNPTLFDSYLVINFSHKFMDLLNITQILRNKELMKTFPSKETYPRISFVYCPTLGSIVFNYANFSKNLTTSNNEYP